MIRSNADGVVDVDLVLALVHGTAHGVEDRQRRDQQRHQEFQQARDRLGALTRAVVGDPVDTVVGRFTQPLQKLQHQSSLFPILDSRQRGTVSHKLVALLREEN